MKYILNILPQTKRDCRHKISEEIFLGDIVPLYFIKQVFIAFSEQHNYIGVV